jgi:hypothetical protein
MKKYYRALCYSDGWVSNIVIKLLESDKLTELPYERRVDPEDGVEKYAYVNSSFGFGGLTRKDTRETFVTSNWYEYRNKKLYTYGGFIWEEV